MLACIVGGLFLLFSEVGTSAQVALTKVTQTFTGDKASKTRRVATEDFDVYEQMEQIGQFTTSNILVIAVFLTASVVCALAILQIRKLVKASQKKQEVIQEAVTKKEMRKEALEYVLSKRNQTLRGIHDDMRNLMLGEAKIGPYVSKRLETVLPTLSCDEALQTLKKKGFRRFLVADSNRKLLGVISRKDLSTAEGGTVAQYMTTNPKTVTPDTKIQTALSILLENRISCLPVVEDGYLVGLVSVSDVLMLFQCFLIYLGDEEKTWWDQRVADQPAAAPVLS